MKLDFSLFKEPAPVLKAYRILRNGQFHKEVSAVDPVEAIASLSVTGKPANPIHRVGTGASGHGNLYHYQALEE